MGFLASFGIRGEGLESGGWDEEEVGSDDGDDDDDDDESDDEDDEEVEQEPFRERQRIQS